MTSVRPQPRRAGFTLVEMLVVIAIIGVLVALTTMAVQAVRQRMADADNASTITGLNSALQEFKGRFYGITPPTQLTLAATQTGYAHDPASLNFLNRMFPKINWSSTANMSTFHLTGINWDGAGMSNGPYVLTGDQVLVFCLGGIPNGTSGGQGFSTNPTDPTDMSMPNRIGPFFNFNAGRFTFRMSNAFASYLDADRQQPYLYFGSTGPVNGFAGQSISGYSVTPYNNGTTYYNPTTWQIICAGRDGVFGPGGTWTPSSALAWGATNPYGADDRTNFYDAKMGVSP